MSDSESAARRATFKHIERLRADGPNPQLDEEKPKFKVGDWARERGSEDLFKIEHIDVGMDGSAQLWHWAVELNVGWVFLLAEACHRVEIKTV